MERDLYFALLLYKNIFEEQSWSNKKALLSPLSF